MPVRVVHLTSVHYPFDNRIFHKECATLVKAGYAVVLIAPHAGGSLSQKGVNLLALKMPRNRIERFLRTVPQVYLAALRQNADIYHFHDPELMPVGALLRLGGKKVICDVHEDYSGSMAGKQWIPKIFRRVASVGVRLCESLLAARCNRIIVATPTIAALFPASKTCLVQNFPWIRELQTDDAPQYADRAPIVVHVGMLSMDRGLMEMAAAMERVKSKRSVKLVLAGRVIPGGGPGIDEARYEGLIEHVGLLSRPQVAALLADARVGIVTLHPTRNYVNSQPTKLYEYMSAGLPVVASDFAVWRQIVEPSGCGILVDPLDPIAIADAIEWLLAHPEEAEEMGRRGRVAVNERYNWEREGESLLQTYAEVLGR